MSTLHDYLTPYYPFTAGEWLRIDAEFLPKPYARNDFLVSSGQTDRYIWFIDTGIVRIFEEPDDATEQTFYFTSAGQFVADPESFGRQIPSLVNIQVVTPCQTRAVSYDGFQRLVRDVPAWNDTVQRITERALMEKVQKRSRLLYEDAKARYLRLLVEQPDVAQYVPLGMIASYLGITLPSLSRLRKQLATQHA